MKLRVIIGISVMVLTAVWGRADTLTWKSTSATPGSGSGGSWLADGTWWDAEQNVVNWVDGSDVEFAYATSPNSTKPSVSGLINVNSIKLNTRLTGGSQSSVQVQGTGTLRLGAGGIDVGSDFGNRIIFDSGVAIELAASQSWRPSNESRYNYGIGVNGNITESGVGGYVLTFNMPTNTANHSVNLSGSNRFGGLAITGGNSAPISMTKISSKVTTLTNSGVAATVNSANGWLVVNGTLNAANGGTLLVSNGGLIGQGRVDMAVTINANLRAGDIVASGNNYSTLAFSYGASRLTFGNSLTLASTATTMLVMTNETTYTSFAVDGLMTYGGVLNLTINGALTDGDYDLFNLGGGFAGNFSTVNVAGTAYTFTNNFVFDVGRQWWQAEANDSTLFTFSLNTGALTIGAIPEPSVVALLAVGGVLAAFVLMRKWRKGIAKIRAGCGRTPRGGMTGGR